jgi:hypothetical protein
VTTGRGAAEEGWRRAVRLRGDGSIEAGDLTESEVDRLMEAAKGNRWAAGTRP